MVLPVGTRLRDVQFTIADGFDYTLVAGDSMALVRLSDGCDLEDCEIVGRPASWWVAKAAAGEPWVWPCRGFGVVGAKHVALRGCSVTDVPAEAFYCREYDYLTMEGLSASRVNAGIAFDWPRVSGNKHLYLNGAVFTDMLSMQSNWNAIGASILFPSLWVGANWVWGMGMENSVIKNVQGYGEGKGVKFTHCDYLALSGLRAPHLSISGKMATPPTGWVGPALVRGNTVMDSVIGESTFGFSAAKSSDPVCISFDSPVDEIVQVDRTTLIAPRAGDLSAPWINPPIAGWRYQVVQGSNAARANFGQYVERIDMNDEQAAPVWFSALDTSTLTTHASIPAVRSYTAHWEAP